ncbi:Lrp/AsnC family transcriptional regulator [Neobacillus sp. 179-J 1A1 HS]|uniref:Lrp/AsnC family transcriptional regulator n=1 Tax=Neobacillus driksii TaxID=3035913 RepID=UPI0035BC80AD
MLDNTDMNILKELTKNSRITMKELGEKIHLTGPATSARMANLEDNGVIEGYTIKVNQEKMGCLVHAIIHIYTKNTNHQPYLSFIKEQDQFVINNYKVSGDSCYLLECKFPGNEILNEFVTGLSNLVNYKLSIVINK